MVWIDDVERFIDFNGCLWIVRAPNLSKYDSKRLPSVKYDWNIASKSCAGVAGVVFFLLKSLGFDGLNL